MIVEDVVFDAVVELLNPTFDRFHGLNYIFIDRQNSATETSLSILGDLLQPLVLEKLSKVDSGVLVKSALVCEILLAWCGQEELWGFRFRYVSGVDTDTDQLVDLGTVLRC